jgi:hypothetical protein
VRCKIDRTKPAGQFTLSNLLLEILWIAAALTCFTQIASVPQGLQFVLLVYGILFSAAAIGGLVEGMPAGFWAGGLLLLITAIANLVIALLLVPHQ